MREIFSKIKAKCFTCKTPLNGEDLNRIGDKFYCQSDYEKEIEKPENEKIRRENIFIKRILKTYI
jgi:hypothetical protein